MLFCFDSVKMLQERNEPRQGCRELTEKSEKKGPWRKVQGVSLGRATTACCSPGCRSREDPYNLGEKIKDVHLREKKGKGILQGEPVLGLCLEGSYLFSKQQGV